MRSQTFVIKGRLDGMNTIIDTNRFASGKKFIFDALQETGVLRNDSMKEICGTEEYFGVDSDRPRIVVMIQEAF